MAVDEELAERVRGHLGDREVAERRMFGGLAFLVGGHMAVCVAGGSGRHGSLMVRCPREQTEALLGEPGAGPMEMQGRELAGWVLVAPAALTDEAALGRWVERGSSYAAGLPPKRG
jgi:hypothetical protein